MARAAIVIVLAALVAHGAEESYPEFGFAFHWPDGEGWTASQPGILNENLLFSRARLHEESGRAIQVRVIKAPEKWTMEDEAYVQGLERGLLKTNLAFSVSRKSRAPFAGVPAFHLHLGGDLEGVPIYIATVMLIANGYQYALSASVPGGDPESEALLPKLHEGFRFLGKPVPPVPVSDAERWGERIGETIVGPLLLIGILLLIARLFRRKRARTIEE